MKKVWTKAEITNLLKTNNTMVEHSLKELYAYQTVAEKAYQTTEEDNKMGFNKPDSRILSRIAEWYLKTGFLTEKQMKLVRSRIMKYAGQLTKIANGVE